MAWATISETLTYTGITVGADNIEAAQAMVELFADVTEDADENISSKNLRLLKMAVAYQAAWISDHPDVFTHLDVSTMLQDGIQYTHSHVNAGVLAPMAKRAIDRLSWRNRNRSIRIRRRKRLYDEHRVAWIGNTPLQDDDVQWHSE